MYLSNGVVGGLALLSLILMTTVVVFGIKFILDRNIQLQREERGEEQKPEEGKEPAEAKPLYMIKQPVQSRKRKPRPRAVQVPPGYAVLPPEAVFTIQPVAGERETHKVS